MNMTDKNPQPNLSKPQPRSGPVWSDLSSYNETNRDGFITIPVVIPVRDAEISEQDMKFMVEQAEAHALVVQQQSRHIAENEVPEEHLAKPRQLKEDATPKEVAQYQRDMQEWRRLKDSSAQRMAAEREIFSFSIQVVAAESAANAAMEIAMGALLSRNYLALDEGGSWNHWCDLTMTEVRRISQQSKRGLSDSSWANIKSWIYSTLPAAVNLLNDNTFTSPSGTVIDLDFIVKNPSLLNEAGSAIKNLNRAVESGSEEAMEEFKHLMSTYADNPRQAAREIIRGKKAANQYTDLPEKQPLYKENAEVFDQATGEVRTCVKYTFYSDTEADEHWHEVQLSARREVVIVDPHSVLPAVSHEHELVEA
jgi:hypothetical protein